MNIWLVNTSSGFVCATDEDYEQKCNLQLGKVYSCTVKDIRNYKFHKLYFALIRCAWDLLTENQQEFYHGSVEAFRKAVEVLAGYYELCYSYTRQEWLECPKSIAFDKLSEAEFHTLYERVKDTLYTLLYQNGISIDTIEYQLKNY